jgi:hypothetical protein
MFEMTPLHFAIGKGWFEDQQGFCLELDFFTINYTQKSPRIYLWGSLFSIYFDIWKEEGEWQKEFSGDFLFLSQWIRRLKNGENSN